MTTPTTNLRHRRIGGVGNGTNSDEFSLTEEDEQQEEDDDVDYTIDNPPPPSSSSRTTTTTSTLRSPISLWYLLIKNVWFVIILLAAVVVATLALWSQFHAVSPLCTAIHQFPNGTTVIDQTANQFCFGSINPPQCTSVGPEDALFRFTGAIHFQVSNVTINIDSHGNWDVVYGAFQRLWAFLYGPKITVFGDGDLQTIATQAQIRTMPPYSYYIAGKSISNANDDYWIRKSIVWLDDGARIYRVQSTQAPEYRGIQISYGLDRTKFVTIPDIDSFPITLCDVSGSQIQANLEEQVVSGCKFIVKNVTFVKDFEVVDSSSLGFDLGTKALSILSYVNGLTPGANNGRRSAVLNPIPNSECQPTSIYRKTLVPIMNQALNCDCQSPVKDVSSLFNTPGNYIWVDTTSCVNATAEVIPGSMVFKFYKESTCNQGIAPERTITVKLPTSGDTYTLLCTTL